MASDAGVSGSETAPPSGVGTAAPSRWTRLRHVLEYRALSTALWGIDRVPLERAEALGRALGRLWFRIDRRRRRVAVENILRAGVESERSAAIDLARRSAEHFALVIVESLRSEEIFARGPDHEILELDVAPDVLEILEDPSRGMVMTSGHFGSWEIGGQRLSRWKPVAGIARPMNNPLVEKLVQERKPRYRFHPIPKYSANPGRFLQVLRAGEILALLTDQHARSGGMPIDFFGHPVQTYPTSAMLHLAARAPLCFTVCERIAPFRFRLSSSPLIQHQRSGDRRADVRAILEQLSALLEAKVRERPDQYVWGHRLWRPASRAIGDAR